MSWRKDGGPMSAFDRQLVTRSGIVMQRRLVLQFYPKEIEAAIAALMKDEAEPTVDQLQHQFDQSWRAELGGELRGPRLEHPAPLLRIARRSPWIRRARVSVSAAANSSSNP